MIKEIAWLDDAYTAILLFGAELQQVISPAVNSLVQMKLSKPISHKIIYSVDKIGAKQSLKHDNRMTIDTWDIIDKR